MKLHVNLIISHANIFMEHVDITMLDDGVNKSHVGIIMLHIDIIYLARTGSRQKYATKRDKLIVQLYQGTNDKYKHMFIYLSLPYIKFMY